MNLFRGLRPLQRAGALRDVLAGVVLAAMDIPQVLGFTKIAGMPVVTGLYTLLLPLVAFAAFGSSRYLVVAADAATAAIFASGMSGLATPAGDAVCGSGGTRHRRLRGKCWMVALRDHVEAVFSRTNVDRRNPLGICLPTYMADCPPVW